MHLDIAFKAFIGVLAAVVIIGSGIGITTGFSQMVEADNYMESVSKVIVESNYSEAVINRCIQEAAENGYTLEYDLFSGVVQKDGPNGFEETEDYFVPNYCVYDSHGNKFEMK